jgi:hypothetical protein
MRVGIGTRLQRLAALPLAAATFAAAGPALAAEGTFQISLRVPAACFVQVPTALVVNDGGSTSGTVVEACNSGGYTVTASYRPLAGDEAAVLQYNGQTIALPASGQVVVRTSGVATIKTIAYQLQSSHLDAPLAISLQISPA